jgi:hypothetical protein
VDVSGPIFRNSVSIWNRCPYAKAAPPSQSTLANVHHSNHPWSMYAVFQTTLTQWAFLLDCLLFASVYFALCEAGYYAVDGEKSFGSPHWQRSLLWTLFLAHWVFAKTIKLVPHLLRNPGDVGFIPVSIIFGYFHNLIKLYGCMTVTEVRFYTHSTPALHGG